MVQVCTTGLFRVSGKKEKLFRENFAWSLHFLRSQKNAKKNLFIRKISLQSVSRKNAKFSQNIKCENFAKKIMRNKFLKKVVTPTTLA